MTPYSINYQNKTNKNNLWVASHNIKMLLYNVISNTDLINLIIHSMSISIGKIESSIEQCILALSPTLIVLVLVQIPIKVECIKISMLVLFQFNSMNESITLRSKMKVEITKRITPPSCSASD